ncbi:hypothetical protein RB601_007582 [Gaeumannomyces tritici]
MSGPPSRLRAVLGHLGLVDKPTEQQQQQQQHQQPEPQQQPRQKQHHLHPLSPTFFLERAASIEPDAEAVVHVTANGKTLRRSYAELADRARGLAYYLLAGGYRRVGIVAPNTPAFLETIFGVGAVPGAVLVPVNYRLKPEDVSYILGFADVDCVVVDAEFVDLLSHFRSEHPGVRFIVDTDTDATEGELSGPFDEAVLAGLDADKKGRRGWAGLAPHPADEDDAIAIPFTSGTTSRPKGVVYTHRGAYLAALANVVESGLNIGEADGGGGGGGGGRHRCRYLWTLPMFHAVGWTFPWAVTAARGTHVCLRRVDYAAIWRLLREERVTHFSAAPTVCTLLCAAPEAGALEAPVRVTVAASPPTAHLFAQMTDLNLRPVHVYGMTETYGPITKGYHMPAWDALPPAEKYALMARQGHGFLTSLPIRVVRTPAEEEQALHQSHHDATYQQQQQQRQQQQPPSDDDDDEVLVDVKKDGKEIGEIVFVGNICAKGYYKDPEATAKLFAGGALHSGDLAVWHPDGSAQILDRAKDIIISGGENISSVALESMLVQHPDVLEAGVVAVPDSRWGERPKAYVTTRQRRGGGGDGNPAPALRGEDLIEWARDQSAISKFMVPREVDVVDELPKTSTGKIRKNVLREWARQGRKPDEP